MFASFHRIGGRLGKPDGALSVSIQTVHPGGVVIDEARLFGLGVYPIDLAAVDVSQEKVASILFEKNAVRPSFNFWWVMDITGFLELAKGTVRTILLKKEKTVCFIGHYQTSIR